MRLLGNVGTAALGQPPGRDYTVMELSSYQIADLEHAPDIAAVTNLFPEHAPWHGGAEQYFRDKLRILDIGEKTKAVCNYANARLRERVAGRANIVWFNRAVVLLPLVPVTAIVLAAGFCSNHRFVAEVKRMPAAFASAISGR